LATLSIKETLLIVELIDVGPMMLATNSPDAVCSETSWWYGTIKFICGEWTNNPAVTCSSKCILVSSLVVSK
jgi:hypothetical protein